MRCGLDDLCGAASWCRASTLSSIATGSLGECFGGGKLASRFGIAQKGAAQMDWFDLDQILPDAGGLTLMRTLMR